jgi:sulfotransferase family protein
MDRLRIWRYGQLTDDLDPLRPRVFCIGLNKTATTSLHEALRVLGLESLHWGGPPIRRLVEAAIDEGRPPVDDLDVRFDAFSDIEALSLNFRRLDHHYPGSRFILTVRPVDDWVVSRRLHVEHNLRRRERGNYTGDFLTVDEPAWRRLWSGHVDGAREYFAGRDCFLEIDLTAGPEWDGLCAFLDVPVPDAPFPWANPAQLPRSGPNTAS